MIERNMASSIYVILFHDDPQALADLDSLQRKRYGVGLSRLSESPALPVTYEYHGEELEDVAREMAQAPSRSRG